jgi:hypothetical protein
MLPGASVGHRRRMDGPLNGNINARKTGKYRKWRPQKVFRLEMTPILCFVRVAPDFN